MILLILDKHKATSTKLISLQQPCTEDNLTYRSLAIDIEYIYWVEIETFVQKPVAAILK